LKTGQYYDQYDAESNTDLVRGWYGGNIGKQLSTYCKINDLCEIESSCDYLINPKLSKYKKSF